MDQSDGLTPRDGKHEVFRGYLDECLRHLARCYNAQVPKGWKGAARSRLSIVQFCQVTDYTVAAWFRDPSKLPLGEVKVRLMCYLELIGYKVLDLEKLKGRRGFTELIGFGLLTVQQAIEILGYSNSSEVHRALRFEGGITEEKARKAWDAWKFRMDDLEKRKEECRGLYPIGFPLSFEKKQVEFSAEKKPQQGVLVAEEPKLHGQIKGHHDAVKSVMRALLIMLQDNRVSRLSEEECRELFFSSRWTIQQLSCELFALVTRLVDKQEEEAEENGQADWSELSGDR